MNRVIVPLPNALGDLRAAFEAYAARREPPNAGEIQALQTHVNTAVDGMKAAGIPPERVIVTLRELATTAGVHWSAAPVFERLVGWCVERYYRPF